MYGVKDHGRYFTNSNIYQSIVVAGDVTIDWLQ